MNVLVMAKAPVPGRVKTRLTPPWTPEQAAGLAAAALTDTLDVVAASAAAPVLVIDGHYPAPAGWEVRPQRGGPLGERLANAFADGPDEPAVLIGMDTPQVTVAHLDDAMRSLGHADAVLGPAADGGWWLLGLRRREYAEVLRDIPTSTSETGALTFAALRANGLRVAELPVLRDVDTAGDAHEVAALCPPQSRFSQAVARASLAAPLSAEARVSPGGSVSPAACVSPGGSVSPAARLSPGGSVSPAARVSPSVGAR